MKDFVRENKRMVIGLSVFALLILVGLVFGS